MLSKLNQTQKDNYCRSFFSYRMEGERWHESGMETTRTNKGVGGGERVWWLWSKYVKCMLKSYKRKKREKDTNKSNILDSHIKNNTSRPYSVWGRENIPPFIPSSLHPTLSCFIK
jgi:hypothetical protein